jgi:hypothetical protein
MARPGRTAKRRPAVDGVAVLAASGNPAISHFAQRELLGRDVGPVSVLWELKEARSIVGRQQPNGSWRYPGGKDSIRSRTNYDQLETFRQVGFLVEQFGFTREHPALARAAEFLFSFQTPEGDFRGIYSQQYATTYVGAIMELLIKAGYADDARMAKAFAWLLSMRQDDGGWAVPLRTACVRYMDAIDRKRYPEPIPPVRAQRSSHLVTGMVLRAFAAHPSYRSSGEGRRAADWFASRLYQRDAYPDRGDPSYWERVSFPFWFTDIVSAFDSLSRFGFPVEGTVRAGIARLRKLERQDGTFALRLLKGKDKDLPWWISLAIRRSFKRLGVAG